jgi:hypothetical protein
VDGSEAQGNTSGRTREGRENPEEGHNDRTLCTPGRHHRKAEQDIFGYLSAGKFILDLAKSEYNEGAETTSVPMKCAALREGVRIRSFWVLGVGVKPHSRAAYTAHGAQ